MNYYIRREIYFSSNDRFFGDKSLYIYKHVGDELNREESTLLDSWDKKT